MPPMIVNLLRKYKAYIVHSIKGRHFRNICNSVVILCKLHLDYQKIQPKPKY